MLPNCWDISKISPHISHKITGRQDMLKLLNTVSQSCVLEYWCKMLTAAPAPCKNRPETLFLIILNLLSQQRIQWDCGTAMGCETFGTNRTRLHRIEFYFIEQRLLVFNSAEVSSRSNWFLDNPEKSSLTCFATWHNSFTIYRAIIKLMWYVNYYIYMAGSNLTTL